MLFVVMDINNQFYKKNKKIALLFWFEYYILGGIIMRKLIILFMVIVSIFGVSCNSGYDVSDGHTNKIVIIPWDGVIIEEIRPNHDGVYEVYNGSQLAWLGAQSEDVMVNIKNIKFMSDIDMGNKPFDGIVIFSGLMDGNDKKINKINIVAESRVASIGLVNTLDNGTIKNLTIESGSVKGGRAARASAAGSFVGIAKGESRLKGLVNRASVEGEYRTTTMIGGIVGKLETDGVLTIKKVQNFGNIKGNAFTGGIVGVARPNSKIIIKNVGNVGTVYGGRSAAGIVGQVDGDQSVVCLTSTLSFNNVYNYGEITSSGNAPRRHIIGQYYNVKEITIDSSFYLEGMANGVINGGTVDGASEKSASDFKEKITFTDWDFATVWKIDNKYPILKIEHKVNKI